MTDHTTPKKRTYSRPVKFPAALSIMTTDVQRAEIDAIVAAEERSVGDVVRELIEIGLDDRLRRNQD